MNTNQIKDLMKKLDISEDEAIELIEEDKKIDKITSLKELKSDLTDEQQKVAKSMTKADRKPTVYQFQKKERKANNDKRDLISILNNALSNNSDVANIDVTNVEREINFTFKDKKYKIVLSAPRT